MKTKRSFRFLFKVRFTGEAKPMMSNGTALRRSLRRSQRDQVFTIREPLARSTMLGETALGTTAVIRERLMDGQFVSFQQHRAVYRRTDHPFRRLAGRADTRVAIKVRRNRHRNNYNVHYVRHGVLAGGTLTDFPCRSPLVSTFGCSCLSTHGSSSVCACCEECYSFRRL